MCLLVVANVHNYLGPNVQNLGLIDGLNMS